MVGLGKDRIQIMSDTRGDLLLPTGKHEENLTFLLRALVVFKPDHDRSGTAALGDHDRVVFGLHTPDNGCGILAKVADWNDLGETGHDSYLLTYN